MLNSGERIFNWSLNVVVLGEVGMDSSHVRFCTSSDTIEVLAQIREIRSSQKAIQGVNGTPVGIRSISSVVSVEEIGMEKAATVNGIMEGRVEIFIEELVEGLGLFILGGQDGSVLSDFVVQQIFGLLELCNGARLVGSFLRVAIPITNVSLVLQSVLLVLFLGDQVLEGDGVVRIDVVNGAIGIIHKPGECVWMLPDAVVVSFTLILLTIATIATKRVHRCLRIGQASSVHEILHHGHLVVHLLVAQRLYGGTAARPDSGLPI